MNYAQGLDVLEQAVPSDDDEVRRNVALYKAQLLDNLRDEERFGDTPELRADRWRIVDKLNPLAERLTDRSFTDLCLGELITPPTPVPSQRAAYPVVQQAPISQRMERASGQSHADVASESASATIPVNSAPEPVVLEMTFEPAGEEGAIVRWESDVLGSRESRLVPPYGATDLPLVLSALDYLQSSEGHTGFSAKEIERLEMLGLAVDSQLFTQAHRAVGTALFKALTADKIGSEALGSARNFATATGAPLAISLHFPPQAVKLAALPWELLWDDRPEPLLIGLGRESTLTRYLDLDIALPPPRRGGRPLIILPVIAQAGLSEEERRTERAAREEAWATLIEQGDATLLQEVSPATREALFDRLDMLDVPPDILHFVGHGKYFDGEGHLVLDKANGDWEPTPVSKLAGQLRGVRMVVLTSCQGAMVTETPGSTLAMLTGGATAISAIGVPLVLAMQLTVRTQAAYRLLEIFYRNVARGRSVQEAMSRARHGLYSEESDGASWYVPVLYIRSRERGPTLMIHA